MKTSMKSSSYLTLVVMAFVLILSTPAQTFGWHVVSVLDGIDIGYNSAPKITDIDDDGLTDIIIGTGGGWVERYEQDAPDSLSFVLIDDRFIPNDGNSNAAPAVCDIDGDGLLDILVGGLDGDVRRWEQDAQNSGAFSLIDGIFITEDNNAVPTVGDPDRDGKLDIFVGHNNSISRWEQDAPGSTTFTKLTDAFQSIDLTNPRPTLFYMDDNNLIDLVIGHNGGQLAHYEQDTPTSNTFTIVTSSILASNIVWRCAAAFGDLDEDGKLDLLVGRDTGEINYYEDESVIVRFSERNDAFIPVDFALTVASDIDGDGLLELLVGSNSQNSINFWQQDQPGSLNFTRLNNGYVMSESRAAPAVADIDGDGLLDLLAGTYWGPIQHWEQTELHSLDFTHRGDNFAGIDEGLESDIAIADVDGDGLLDLIVAVGETMKLYHYKQDAAGSLSFTKITDAFGGIEPSTNQHPSPTFTDLEGDGLLDLIIGVQEGEGTDGEMWHCVQDSPGSMDFTVVTQYFQGIGARDYGHPKPSFTDLDGDGRLDFLFSERTHAVRHWRSNLRHIDGSAVTTTVAASVTSWSAELGGEITADQGHLVTRRGVAYSSTNTMPDFLDTQLTVGSGLGSFSGTVNLNPGNTYYHRAFRSSSLGTVFGQVESFLTPAVVPLVTTKAVTGVSNVSAQSGGIITHQGGEPVDERGICLSESPDPAYGVDMCLVGGSTFNFTVTINGLVPDTTYFLRAFAHNSVGVGYGENETFHTDDMPALVGHAVYSVDFTSAMAGGEVTDENGASATARGVCWSTAPAPTTADSYTADGAGMGVYDSTLTGLQPDTRYYLRAYATNTYGTRYGDEQSFSTPKRIRGMLSFDGAGSSFAAPFSMPDSGTIEVWFYADVNDTGVLWDGNDGPSWECYLNNNDLMMTAGGSRVEFSGVQTHQWYHMALTWESYDVLGTEYGNSTLYVNGNNVDEALGDLWNTSGSSMVFGASIAGHTYFDGRLEELRVWTTIRTEAQIRADMHQEADPAAPGLALYYDFDYATGTTVADRTGNGYTGVMSLFPADPWLISTGPAGDVGASVRSTVPASIGDAGQDVTVTIISGGDDVDYLGVYTYGPGDGQVEGDVFPAGVTQRLDLVWGLFEFGAVTSDLVIDYSGVGGIEDASAIKLLSRASATSDWTDVTASFVHDTGSRTFTGTGITEFSELAIGDGGENPLGAIFADGFESGDTNVWTVTVP